MIEPERGGLKFPPERILFLLTLAFFAWQASSAVRGWPALEPLGAPGRSNLRFDRPQGESWLQEVPFDALWRNARRNNPFLAPSIPDPDDFITKNPNPPPTRRPDPPPVPGALTWPARAPMPPDKGGPPAVVGPVAPPVPADDRPAVTVAGVIRMEGADDRYWVILTGGAGPTKRLREGEVVEGTGLRIVSANHGRVLVEDVTGRRFEARDVLWSDWKKLGTP
ncbi:MAG: hypothetical protein AAB215_05460 [Planctomycetota bacterium]